MNIWVLRKYFNQFNVKGNIILEEMNWNKGY